MRARWVGAFTAAILVGLASPALAAPWVAKEGVVRAWRGTVSDADLARFTMRVQPLDYWKAGLGLGVWFKDYRQFHGSHLPAGTRVFYDLEGKSPARQRYHPTRYLGYFAALARARSLVPILSPSRTVVRDDRDCGWRWVRYANRIKQARQYARAYLYCGLAHVRSRYLLLQSERMECDRRGFLDFVQGAHRQARAKMLVELTVSDFNSGCATASVVQRAWSDALPYAYGYGMWGRGRPELAAQVLPEIPA
jgi:hypothetical protein